MSSTPAPSDKGLSCKVTILKYLSIMFSEFQLGVNKLNGLKFEDLFLQTASTFYAKSKVQYIHNPCVHLFPTVL